MPKKRVEKREPFRLPDFDRERFVSEEINEAKQTAIAFALAVGMGAVSGALTIAGVDFRIAAAVGLAAMLLLRFLFVFLRTTLDGMTKGKWAGHGFTYAITWVVVWVLLVNMPVVDLSSPTIKDRTVPYQEVQTEGGKGVAAAFTILDNDRVVEPAFSVTGPAGSALQEPLQRDGATYTYRINTTLSGRYSYSVSAHDPAGHAARLSANFTLLEPSPPNITLWSPQNGSPAPRSGPVTVIVRDNAGPPVVVYLFDIGTASPVFGVPSKTKAAEQYSIPLKSLPPGNHTLDVFAVDRAGYTAHQWFWFTVL